jgi:SPP1 family predicted phage head-tail adaptor
MTQAGDLRELIELQSLVTVSDGAGGSTTSWVSFIDPTPARIKVLRGGETVMQGRLASMQTLVITLRWQPAFMEADTTLRLVNVRTSENYNILTITPDERKQFVDILCQTEAL